MNFLEKYTYKNKHFIIIVILAIILIIFALSIVFFIRKIQFAEKYTNDYILLSNYFHNLSKNKAILLENKTFTKDFYNSGVENHLIDFTNEYNLFYTKIEEIKNNKRTKKFSFENQVQKISEDIVAYNEKLVNIFTIEQTIGNNNYGLMKNLFFAKNQIEEIFNENEINSELQNNINTLFLIQSNFEEFRNVSDYDGFQIQYDEIKNKLFKSDTTNVFNKYIVHKISDLLAEYKDNFYIIFEKRISIGLSETEGIIGELTDKESIISENISQLIKDNSIKVKLYLLRLYIFTFLTILLSVLIIIFLLKMLLDYYNKNIHEIKNNIGKIAKGELVDLKTNNLDDDFGIINNQIVNFVNGTKEKLVFAEQIKEKKFDANLNLLSSKDLLGKSLVELKNSLQKSEEEAQILKKAEDIQDWKTAGLAKFGEVMRKNTDNLVQLSTEVIKQLIVYVEASQGGFYIYNDENQNNIFLELTAHFAYGKEKIANKQIALHEGLIGTCAVEKNKFYFEKIPDEYIYIASGFGQAKPQSLIILPLTVDKNIYGVIELAALRKFHDYELDFLDKLAIDIAITVSYVKINDETARFLKMSERQTRKLLRKQHESTEQITELEKNLDLTTKKLIKKEQVLKLKDELIAEKVRELNKAFIDYKAKENQQDKLNSEIRILQSKIEESSKTFSKEKTELLNKITLLESEIQHLRDLKND